VIGDPASAAAQLLALAERHGIGEIMVSPGAAAHVTDPLDRVPGRENTLRLLARELL